MVALFCEDLYFVLASCVDKSTLPALALVSKCCRRPAQAYLFRTFTVFLDLKTPSVDAYNAFLESTPRLAGNVRVLQFLGRPKLESIVHVNLIERFLVTCKLATGISLVDVRWRNSEGSQTIYPALTTVLLDRVVYTKTSPFQLLRLSPSWTQITIVKGEFPRGVTAAEEALVTVDVLAIQFGEPGHVKRVKKNVIYFPLSSTIVCRGVHRYALEACALMVKRGRRVVKQFNCQLHKSLICEFVRR